MKKYIFFFVFFLLTAIASFAQSDSVLHWLVASKKISDSVYELKATAVVPAGWHLYGANPNIDGVGAETVQFTYDYENAQNIQPTSISGKAEQINDSIFNKKANVYRGSVTVTQRVNIHGVVPEELTGAITVYLGKNDEFLAPGIPFAVRL